MSHMIESFDGNDSEMTDEDEEPQHHSKERKWLLYELLA